MGVVSHYGNMVAMLATNHTNDAMQIGKQRQSPHLQRCKRMKNAKLLSNKCCMQVGNECLPSSVMCKSATNA